MDTTGRIALVTGGARRIGSAVSEALGRAGVHVAVHYNTSRADAEATVKRIQGAGGRAMAFQADLSDDTALGTLIPSVAKALGGPVDVLVNNASIFRDQWLDETTNDAWDENFAVNVRGPFVLARDMARALGGRPGKIVNMGDWQSARPKRFAYGVSKAALTGLTRSLARALAPGVQVNEIALGAILLPPGAGPDYANALAARTPAKRLGTVEEVAETVLWLIANDYVTGETIRVDGGQHLGRA